MKKAIIICGAPIYDYDYMKAMLNEVGFVICCDSGIYHAKKMGITPDLIVGDFDSADPSIFEGVERKTFIPEKDETDGQIAVDYALSNDFDFIVIIGGLGGRLDHSLGNISLLKRIERKGKIGMLASEQNIVMLLTPALPYEEDSKNIRHKYISLISLGRDAVGVCESGVKYPLKKAVIPYGSTLGVSNEVSGDKVCLSVEDGDLLLVFSDDN